MLNMRWALQLLLLALFSGGHFTGAQDSVGTACAHPCHSEATCAKVDGGFECRCERGFLGNGTLCSGQGWAVRASFTFQQTQPLPATFEEDAAILYSTVLLKGSFRAFVSDKIRSVAQMAAIAAVRDDLTNQTTVTLNGIFATEQEAQVARTTILRGSRYAEFLEQLAEMLHTRTTALDDPQVYVWGAEARSTNRVEVEAAEFRQTCGADGCWVVDLKFTDTLAWASTTGRPLSVVYLPHSTPDQTAFLNTFELDTFPCKDDLTGMPGTPTYKAQSTICCLETFTEKYRPVQSFLSWIDAHRVVEQCSNSTPASSMLEGLTSQLSGPFWGMPASSAQHRGRFDKDGNLYGLRLELDAAELKEHAAVVSSGEGSPSRLDLFVGIVDLTPTGTVTIVPKASQQWILLERGSGFTAFSQGAQRHDIVDLDLSLHQVQDPSGGEALQLQLVTVRVKLASGVRLSSREPLIHIETTQVAQSTVRGRAEWEPVCGAGLRALQRDWEAVRAQGCAPQVDLCQLHDLGGDEYELHIPLGRGYLQVRPAGADEMAVHLQMPLSTTDRGGREVSVKMEASLPVSQQSVVSHCADNQQASDLPAAARVDVLVGAGAERAAVVEGRWGSAQDAAVEVGSVEEGVADGLEGGLLTVHLKGFESAWHGPAQSRSNLVLLDLVSVHLMQAGGRSKFEEVVASIEDGTAFSVTTANTLQEGAALAGVCSFDAPLPTRDDLLPSACRLRRELGDEAPAGYPSRTAVELGTADWEAVAQFGEGMLDGPPAPSAREWRDLAVERAEALDVNGRYNRAWWVNPGHAWWPAAEGEAKAYALSSHVILVALVGKDVASDADERMPVVSCAERGGQSKCIQLVWHAVTAADVSHAQRECRASGGGGGGDLASIRSAEELERVSAMNAGRADELWVGYDDTREGSVQSSVLVELESAVAVSMVHQPLVGNASSCGMLKPQAADLQLTAPCAEGRMPAICSFVDEGKYDASGRPECYQPATGRELVCFWRQADQALWREVAEVCSTRNQGRLASVDFANPAQYKALLSVVHGEGESWIAPFTYEGGLGETWTAAGSYTHLQSAARLEWHAIWTTDAPSAGSDRETAADVECALLGRAAQVSMQSMRCSGRKGFVCSFEWDMTQHPSFDRDAVEIFIGSSRREGSTSGGAGLVDKRRAGQAQYAVSASAVKFAADAVDMIAQVNGQAAGQAASWNFELKVDSSIACGSGRELRQHTREMLLQYLRDSVRQTVYDTQITSYAVEGCARREQHTRVEVEAVLLLEDPSANLATEELLSKPNLVSMRPAGESAPITAKDDDSDSDVDADDEAESDGGGGGLSIAVIAGAAAGGAVLLVAIGFVAVKRCSSGVQKVLVEEDDPESLNHCSSDFGYLHSPRASAPTRRSMSELTAELPSSLKDELQSGGGSPHSRLERNISIGALRRSNSNVHGNRASLASQLSNFSGPLSAGSALPRAESVKEDLMGELDNDTVLALARDSSS